MTGKPISPATVFASSNSARSAADISHTGRVTPRVTSKRSSGSVGLIASMRSTIASRSACRFAIDSDSATAVVGTQFTHWPACTTPTEQVASSVVIASMARICLAISRTAKNPDNAFKAIQFLTSPEAQQTIIDLGQDVPASVAVQQSDAFRKPTWMTKTVNMKAFGDSSAFVYRAPFIPEWNEMQKAFDDGLANFFLGKQDARSALDAIQKQLESIIKPA